MKFRTKKFMQDREKSYERSKKGELGFLLNGKPVGEDLIQTLKSLRSENYDKIQKCLNRMEDIS